MTERRSVLSLGRLCRRSVPVSALSLLCLSTLGGIHHAPGYIHSLARIL
jgi:hypothetical protein